MRTQKVANNAKRKRASPEKVEVDVVEEIGAVDVVNVEILASEEEWNESERETEASDYLEDSGLDISEDDSRTTWSK
jgi:hypothetical protein